MHIHHAYIGMAILAVSAAQIEFGVPMQREFYPWWAWVGLIVGAVVFSHDLYCHLRNWMGKR